jgi:hypothetical protein
MKLIHLILTCLWTAQIPTPLAADASVADESARDSLLAEMAKRPSDPWPRGTGHVILGMPGLPENWKAYHEPGGSFSPAFASFGISLWVVDDQNRLLTTSDTLPIQDVTQRITWSDKVSWPPLPSLPAIETLTPYYVGTWRVLGAGRYQFHVRSKLPHPLWIMVRSAGPAGGVIRSLQWSGGRLYVNGRWTLTVKGPGPVVDVGAPGGPDPGIVRPAIPFWPAEQPSGYARIQLLPAQDYWLTVEAVEHAPESPLPPAEGRSALKLTLPDPRFADCLDAQVGHLLMGLVRNETRPGDPNNYPLNWLRDGAYTLVALARAGRLEVARELCSPFAEQDFFGGFGAEADAPGLALWALDEVSVRLGDTRFEDWLWPNVVRKVQLIQEMLAAKGSIRKPFTGPIVPAHTNRADLDLVCEAARDGLIVGRMDWQRPMLYVNAVTYRGLLGAAAMATRQRRLDEAAAWSQQAAALREAWNRALQGPEAANERTAICGLHPTWIVSDRDLYRRRLEEHRRNSHDSADRLKERPLWTYFNLAAAHQWLLLGDATKVWNDLEWFWSNQASPGLWTWWEGRGEENTFHRWEQARGWTRPPHVTPHYWTAAEMALLQLDMLACLDESSETPRLLIGPGIPKSWLDQTLRVEGLSTRLGRLDWEWRRGRLTVTFRGPKVDIVPGPAFPADAELRIRD